MNSLGAAPVAGDAFGAIREGVAPRPAFSIGSYLASQRRLRGLSLEELESVTRIPRRSLERLESGAFDCQQDAFVRGFVRTVCGAIGLDECDTMARMLSGGEEAGRPGARVRRRPGTPRLGLALLAAFSVLLAIGCAFAGAVRLPEFAAEREAPVTAEVVMPRDYVRELLAEVRSAPPGTYARAVPVAPPPAMYLTPAPDPPLDALLPRQDAPPAVSSGPTVLSRAPGSARPALP